MKKIFNGYDWTLATVALFLSFFGLIIIGSLTPTLIRQQVLFIIIGIIFFVIFSQIDYRIFSKFSFLIFSLNLIFLAAPLIFGKITRGTFRWLYFGPFNVQPSELVKPFLIIFFASFFDTDQKISFKKFLSGAFLLMVPVILIFLQPDLGSAIVIAFSWLGIVIAAGIAWKFLIISFSTIALFLPIVWNFLKDYQQQRIYSFLNPLKDPLGVSYNAIQAIIAIGSGQFVGRGLGRGTQSQLRFLPERYTDFIFASLAEELGFLGSLILVLGFAFLLWRILVTSRQTKDTFGALFCLGVFSNIFIQVFINMGMNLGLLPITGITLPLISSGGSSLIATLISLGIVENIARLKKKEETIIIR